MEVNKNFPVHRNGERNIADRATELVADYIAECGIQKSVISRKTGISDGILRRSLSSRKRSLRADEFLKICRFLGKDPFNFFLTQIDSTHEKPPQAAERRIDYGGADTKSAPPGAVNT